MALPRSADAFVNPIGGLFTYTGGIVSNPQLTGAAGELILNVYLAVDQDGRGVGTVSDVLHPEVNCHLAVQQGGRQGNTVRFAGVVQAAKDSALVDAPFKVTGVVTENFTSLALQWQDVTFLGKGFLVSAPKFTTPIGQL